MSRATLTLEVLAQQWARDEIEALAICGHPHGRVAVAGTAHATQTDRWYYCLYGKRPTGWEVVREAQNSALRARTWWRLDQCLKALTDRGVVPRELRLLPRGPAPAEFPKLPVETAPTESARRRPVPARKAPAPKQVRPGTRRALAWLDDSGADGDESEGGGQQDPWDL